MGVGGVGARFPDQYAMRLATIPPTTVKSPKNERMKKQKKKNGFFPK